MSMLDIRNVTHTYASGSGRPVLKDVSLRVDRGEVVAIVGESGCGKTTLGRMIAGLYSPTGGVIAFDGNDIANLRGRQKKAWRRKVQMIHQDPYGSLNPGLTNGSALAPGMLKHGLATGRDVQQKMIALLRSVGLDATKEFLQRYPHQLSGGQRQRASIARSIALQPDLIVADEVTSMLDVSMRVAILDLLLSFKKDQNIAFVFISHDFGVVRYFAQGGRIAVMFFGYIVEEGPTEEVITAPKHPYTHMLLEAIPIPDPVLARERAQGDEAARLIGAPAETGCVFANRCPLARARCRTERPELVDQGSGHSAACHYADEVPPLLHVELDKGEAA
jgi:oligopeptide/dipeptide ABC transporter ATP-binding protein